MEEFAQLYSNLAQTTKTNLKISLLEQYFLKTTPEDNIWALFFLSGRKFRQQLSSKDLKNCVLELTNYPEWLFIESYSVVGDLAETISLLLPSNNTHNTRSLTSWLEDLMQLKNYSLEQKKEFIKSSWAQFNQGETILFNKLITGGFRIGVSQSLVIKSLTKVVNLTEPAIAHRLTGKWTPENISWVELFNPNQHNDDHSKPYVFCLANPITESELNELAITSKEWLAEWKWDGIRAQFIFRNNELYIWSRGEELITARFPEFIDLVKFIPPGTVIDGEILAFRDNKVLDFAQLQKRIGRKNPVPKLIQEIPVTFYSYDLLEYLTQDYRDKPLRLRREGLAQLTNSLPKSNLISMSKPVNFKSIFELKNLRETSRANSAEGLMLKKLDTPYVGGRKRGIWFKWKIEPFTLDVVLLYAQRGHGKRANLYTDYTLAVWDEQKLVPIAKAYSGLTDKEIAEVDQFIKQNTLERFGPVRTVKPELVFEIGFEGIQYSSRHKSGIALRFPRILRWRLDKKIADADTLNNVKDLLKTNYDLS